MIHSKSNQIKSNQLCKFFVIYLQKNLIFFQHEQKKDVNKPLTSFYFYQGILFLL